MGVSVNTIQWAINAYALTFGVPDGVHAAFRLDAALSLVGFLVAVLFVGGRLVGRPAPPGEPAG